MKIDGYDIWEAREEVVDEYEKFVDELSWEERVMVDKILDMFIAKLVTKSTL